MPKVLLIALVLVLGSRAGAQTVQEFARLGGESESVVQGLGLVMGLPGTGDDGEYIGMAAPLLSVLQNAGNPVPSVAELEDTNSVALVMVMARIGPDGARSGDELDADVLVVGNASSLEGGVLFLSPLRGPLPGAPVYAMAQGRIELEDSDTPTVGTIRRGATVVQDVRTSSASGALSLRILPEFAGWPTSTEIASRINQEWFGTTQAFGPAVATPVDNRTVSLSVPADQRSDVPSFISDVLATPVNPVNFRMPAVVRVNRRTGAIIATAEVTIGAVAITHKDLVITTTVPEPVPTPEEPLIDRSKWAGIGTSLGDRESAKLADLTAAFEQLDIPAEDRVEILQMMHRTGKLHARLVVEGSD